MKTDTYTLDKAAARKAFDGSQALFVACWRQYLGYLNGSIDNPSDQADVDNWLQTIAAEKVNNPKSRFYIYG